MQGGSGEGSSRNAWTRSSQYWRARLALSAPICGPGRDHAGLHRHRDPGRLRGADGADAGHPLLHEQSRRASLHRPDLGRRPDRRQRRLPARGPYDPTDEGPYPVMMLFHGYAGSKLGLGLMKHWLDQGYATFSHDDARQPPVVRHGRRLATAGGAACDDGYVRLMDTRYEVRDAQELIALLVDEGLIDPERDRRHRRLVRRRHVDGARRASRTAKMLPDGSLMAWESPERHAARDRGRGPRHPVDRPRVRARPQRRQPRLHRGRAVPRPRRPRRHREGGVRRAASTAAGAVNGYYAPEGSGPRGRHHRLEERPRHGRPVWRRGARRSSRRSRRITPRTTSTTPSSPRRS